ncbi:MAG: nucleoside deaminase [Deltaproteobacteria bacterium]|jgi:guanine deaminase|nr:nucleoside deaminase [Deltaproteobacteria bacterium]MBT6432829.1 nucleoside deaminase [Deltaproteobacteria bacterium]MBT6489708.1 nucleoside deaminase [Deltaproteobacteria bacterium]
MPVEADDSKYLAEAIRLAQEGASSNRGGPFGAIIVKDGKIIGKGNNGVTSTNDPTAHAEVTAIRHACKEIADFQLDGTTIYSSCEPCPMCLAAIYWARIERVVYACTRDDAADIGFDDAHIYNELPLSNEERSIRIETMMRDEGLEAFKAWREKGDKVRY